HAEVHQAAGALDDYFLQETARLKNQLAETEQKLRKAKLDANVTSLDGTKKLYSEQIAKIQGDLLHAEAELAAHRAVYDEMLGLSAVRTNATPAATNNPGNQLSTPSSKLAEYKRVCGLIDSL